MSILRIKRNNSEAELDMTPMLDVVFIMLIFFIVTTSFVKESGIDVNTPQAQSASKQDDSNIFVAIDANGAVWIDHKMVDIRSVRAVVARLYAENPNSVVIIQSDEEATTRKLVGVMDQIRMAGIEKIAIAANQVK
ncbi:MAG: biopolymer transporter ExbD [Gammaproteobacteria bacterium]|nr:MAG: biopolymer transporter ExbD [Gammaproteobacteria bacterium]